MPVHWNRCRQWFPARPYLSKRRPEKHAPNPNESDEQRARTIQYINVDNRDELRFMRKFGGRQTSHIYCDISGARSFCCSSGREAPLKLQGNGPHLFDTPLGHSTESCWPDFLLLHHQCPPPALFATATSPRTRGKMRRPSAFISSWN